MAANAQSCPLLLRIVLLWQKHITGRLYPSMEDPRQKLTGRVVQKLTPLWPTLWYTSHSRVPCGIRLKLDSSWTRFYILAQHLPLSSLASLILFQNFPNNTPLIKHLPPQKTHLRLCLWGIWPKTLRINHILKVRELMSCRARIQPQVCETHAFTTALH